MDNARHDSPGESPGAQIPEMLDVYLATGFAVFPVHEMLADGQCSCLKRNCTSPGKHPRTQRGLRDASKEPATVAEWWRNFPNANIGIVTGSISGCFVLDIDSKSGGFESLQNLEARHQKLPKTPLVETGGGGRHYFFVPPANMVVKNSTSQVGDGIDVRGDGGYVVAAPSNHVSGGQYHWLNDLLTPLAAAPDWLLETIASNTRQELRTIRNDGSTISYVDPLAPGRRNNTMTSIAGHMQRAGFDQWVIYDTLTTINHSAREPVNDNEVAGIAKSIQRYNPTLLADLSELGVSSLFAHHILGKAMYSENAGWMAYKDGVWSPDSEGLQTQELAKDLVARIHDEAVTSSNDRSLDEARRKAIRSADKQCQNKSFIGNITKLSRSDPLIFTKFSAQDSDLRLFNLGNGTLNLRTLELQDHSPEDRLTKIANVHYDPDATCPVFDQFLADILDEETGNFVLRALGYSLLGDPIEQKLFVAVGSGRNGKSSLLNLFTEMMGNYSVTADPQSFLKSDGSSIRNDIARLRGSRFCMTTEFPQGAILDAPLIKRLTGGDPVTARFLHKEYFEFQPIFVPFLVTNDLPVINGGDAALARRFVVIHFPKVIELEKVDLNLDKKLRTETSGIFNRILHGLRDYQSQHLAIPDAIIAATEAYVNEANLIRKFCQERIQTKLGEKARASEVFMAYKVWCSENNYRPLSAAQFKRAFMAELNADQARDSRGLYWPDIVSEKSW